jgi:hypothetical protein
VKEYAINVDCFVLQQTSVLMIDLDFVGNSRVRKGDLILVVATMAAASAIAEIFDGEVILQLRVTRAGQD